MDLAKTKINIKIKAGCYDSMLMRMREHSFLYQRHVRGRSSKQDLDGISEGGTEGWEGVLPAPAFEAGTFTQRQPRSLRGGIFSSSPHAMASTGLPHRSKAAAPRPPRHGAATLLPGRPNSSQGSAAILDYPSGLSALKKPEAFFPGRFPPSSSPPSPLET